MTDIAFDARTVFQGLSVPAAAQGRGVLLEERVGFGLATLIARRNRGTTLVDLVRHRIGVELPAGPRLASARDVMFVGTSVDTWLVLLERAQPHFAASLKEAVTDSASVADQSDGHGIVRVTGPNARDVLCKLVPVDLHPGAFKVGDVAATIAGHVGVTLWRLEDQNGQPVFELAVARSMAECFWRSLVDSAAEFGVTAISAH